MNVTVVGAGYVGAISATVLAYLGDRITCVESDPVRRNRLQLLGWIVIEVTWRRFVQAPESVIAEVAEALGW